MVLSIRRVKNHLDDISRIEILAVSSLDTPSLLHVFHEPSLKRSSQLPGDYYTVTIFRDRVTQQENHTSCNLETRLRMSLEDRSLMEKRLTSCILEEVMAFARKKRLTTSRSITNSFEPVGTLGAQHTAKRSVESLPHSGRFEMGLPLTSADIISRG